MKDVAHRECAAHRQSVAHRECVAHRQSVGGYVIFKVRAPVRSGALYLRGVYKNRVCFAIRPVKMHVAVCTGSWGTGPNACSAVTSLREIIGNDPSFSICSLAHSRAMLMQAYPRESYFTRRHCVRFIAGCTCYEAHWKLCSQTKPTMRSVKIALEKISFLVNI